MKRLGSQKNHEMNIHQEVDGNDVVYSLLQTTTRSDHFVHNNWKGDFPHRTAVDAPEFQQVADVVRKTTEETWGKKNVLSMVDGGSPPSSIRNVGHGCWIVG